MAARVRPVRPLLTGGGPVDAHSFPAFGAEERWARDVAARHRRQQTGGIASLLERSDRAGRRVPLVGRRRLKHARNVGTRCGLCSSTVCSAAAGRSVTSGTQATRKKKDTIRFPFSKNARVAGDVDGPRSPEGMSGDCGILLLHACARANAQPGRTCAAIESPSTLRVGLLNLKSLFGRHFKLATHACCKRHGRRL